ncbi:type II toxin-antitoxin system RelE/ParE family toxin [soil metagenome]
MAQIIWMEPALSDLDRIAEYIALDNPDAAERLVQRVFDHVGQLEAHPESGSYPLELNDSRYRQIIEPPCRVFYRYNGEEIHIHFVMRHEQKLKKAPVRKREKLIADILRKRDK